MADRSDLARVLGSSLLEFKFEFDDVRGCLSCHSADQSDADVELLSHVALKAVLDVHRMGYAGQVSG